MPAIQIEISNEDLEELTATARERETTPDALAARWLQERLLHERERAAGGGRPMSPRARREQDRRD